MYPGPVRRGKEWDAFRATHQGAEIITRSEMADAEAIADGLRSDRLAMTYLGGTHELKIQWEWCGVPCSGAIDVWTTPVQMKKGRPGIVVSALARPETEAAVARGFGARLRPDVIAGRLARPTEVAARGVARFLVLTAGTHGSAEAGGFKGMHVRRPNVDGYIPSREGVACGTARIRLPGDTLVLAQDAASIDPRAAARWLFLARGAFSGRDPSAGIGHPEGLPASDGFGAVRPAAAMLDTWLAGHLPFGAATSCLDAASVIPERLPEGTVVYIDPDYEGTTGYAHTFPREAVLEAAARWRSAGAVVAVSEAAPLPLPGWHALEITGCRRGQRRTFSRQRSEWLTLSHPPAWTPDVQADMFATEAGCG